MGTRERALTLSKGMTPSAELKDALPEDYWFLREMLLLAANWREDERLEQEPLSDPKVLGYVHGWGRPGDAGIISIINNEPVGVAWYRLFRKNEPGFGFVDEETPELSMAVRRDHRGVGLGELLLGELVARAKSNGYSSVSLSVEPDNPARKLYEKHDFKKFGESAGAWTMVKELSQ
jgi:ribosomal protein S18 acetylase RimI-like enzyme